MAAFDIRQDIPGYADVRVWADWTPTPSLNEMMARVVGQPAFKASLPRNPFLAMLDAGE